MVFYLVFKRYRFAVYYLFLNQLFILFMQNNYALIPNYIRTITANYANFSGRAGRKEYWMFFLANVLIWFILGFLSVFFLNDPGETAVYNVIGYLYSAAFFIPGLALTIRRLHDTDKSGWWCLIVLIPFIGVIILFVFLVQDSQEGSNEYGLNPKEPQPDAENV